MGASAHKNNVPDLTAVIEFVDQQKITGHA